MALIEDLISKGFFPTELTPAFSTEDLVNILPDILITTNSFSPLPPNKVPLSKPILFSIPKIKMYRRYLGIPNPFGYIRLSHTISENWDEIVKCSERSRISLSKLLYPSSDFRAIPEPDFNNIKNERILRSIGFKYLLILDISQFYPSIYTHSIPWALHGKSIAKRKRKRSDLFGNALDEDCRNLQDGQTTGIPIGPDTSRIISEVIVSAIDYEINAKLTYLCGIRNVDDFYLYFKTIDDLEYARSTIQRTLKEYGLELNISKDRIINLPELIEPEWKEEIRRFVLRDMKKQQRTDIISFFDLIFRYSRSYPNDYVLNYALSKIRGFEVLNENWDIMESLLLKTILLEPRVLPLLNEIFIGYSKYGHPINNKNVCNTLIPFIESNLQNDNHFEVIWSLWLFKSLQISIPEKLAISLSDATNPIVILSILDLFQQKLIKKGLKFAKWKTFLKEENLNSEYWILAYEANVKNWLTVEKDYLKRNPFYNFLKENKVEFYKTNKEIDFSKLSIFYNMPSEFENKMNNELKPFNTELDDLEF